MTIDEILIVKELLERGKALDIDPELVSKLLDDILTMVRWCHDIFSNITADRDRICSTFFALLNDVLLKLEIFRFRKLIDGAQPSERSFDIDVLTLAKRVFEEFRSIVTTSIRTRDMYVLCKVKKPFSSRSMIYTPGYVVILPLREVLLLKLLGFVEPLGFEHILNFKAGG